MNFIKYLYYMFYRPKIFFPKKTYAMFGEDLVINNFFKNKRKGIYIDIGCYHPLDGSNTYLLYKKGWKGINVDINKYSIDLFNIARKRDQNYNYAISNISKKVRVYYRKKINMLNTINKKSAIKNFKKGFSSSYINSITLNSLLNFSKFKGKKIDFLNLDVEGNELKVLKSLNFTTYKPKVICVEIHRASNNDNKNYYKNSDVYKLLKKKGYKLLWNYDYSFIFKT
mgnify:FL=1